MINIIQIEGYGILKHLNKELDQLNDLITDYNASPSPLLLQRIDAQAKMILTSYHENPEIVESQTGVKRKASEASPQEMRNIFMKWYFTHPIEHEIHKLLQSSNQAKTKEINQLTSTAWKKSTTPKVTIFSNRSSEYSKMDNLIHRVEKAEAALKDKQDLEEDETMEQRELYEALIKLQINTGYFLNHLIPETKPKMVKQFNHLFHYASTNIDKLLKVNPDLDDRNTLSSILSKDEEIHMPQLSLPQKEKFFLSILSPSISSLTDWKKLTEHEEEERPSLYKKIDDALNKVDLIREKMDKPLEYEDSNDIEVAEDEDDLNNALMDLQKKTMELLQDETIRSNEIMKQELEQLLDSTNYHLNELTSKYQWIKSNYQAGTPLSIANEEAIEKLVSNLKFDPNNPEHKSTFTLGSLEVSYLGGKNNKNWKITDTEGLIPRSILRLEPAETTDYWLLGIMRKSEKLCQHLAIDTFYFPYVPPGAEGFEAYGYHVVWSEYCANQDLLTYSSKANLKGQKKLDQALDLTQKVAALTNDFLNAQIVYPDIKATNFLLRDDGTVYTGDLKAVVPTDNKGITPRITIISHAYEPPHTQPVNTEKYMSFKIGLMLYELIVAPGDSKSEKSWLDRSKPLDFDMPIFKSTCGKKIKSLIESAMSSDPNKRPSLEEIVTQCKVLKVDPIIYKEQVSPSEEKPTQKTTTKVSLS